MMEESNTQGIQVCPDCGNKFPTACCDPDLGGAMHDTPDAMRRNFLDTADPPGMKWYICQNCGRESEPNPTMAEATEAWNALKKRPKGIDHDGGENRYAPDNK